MGIKEKIISRVNTIDNPKILSSILNLISSETETDEVYQFTDDERAHVSQGIEDAENGNVYSQEESDNIISKWLDEKSSGLLGQ